MKKAAKGNTSSSLKSRVEAGPVGVRKYSHIFTTFYLRY